MKKHFSEVKISYRTDKRLQDLPHLRDPESAAELLFTIWDKKTIELREEFVVLLLNAAKKCIGWYKVSTGTLTGTLVDPSTLFRTVLLSNAHSIILAHNHPSGSCLASQADITLTKRIAEIGELLGIRLEDHIILCPRGAHMSMRSRGFM